MQKTPPRQRPAAALDNPQLDLPFVQPSSPAMPPAPPMSATPASSVPGVPAMPATLRGDIAPTEPLVVPSPPPRLADGTRHRELLLGARKLMYRLKRSSRRTIGFTIDGTGLAITAPRWVTIADIESAIVEKETWIFKKLGEWQARAQERALPRIEWKDGAQLPYLGRTISIMLTAVPGSLDSTPFFDADKSVLWLALPRDAQPQHIRERVQRWLHARALHVFGERLPVYATKLGVTFRAYALSSAATRW